MSLLSTKLKILILGIGLFMILGCVFLVRDLDRTIQNRFSYKTSNITSVDRAVVKVFSEWGHGSGFIIDSKGLILTAAHVVDNEWATYQVQLYDGSIYPVRAEKYVNEELDVAVLRIDPNDPLDMIKLVLSDNYPVGTAVQIIGSPFGYNQWHSYGHIARPREKHAIFLDIDANSGISGGPILVGDKCIGILAAIIWMSDMSFGISSEACLAVIDIYNILYGPIHVKPH